VTNSRFDTLYRGVVLTNTAILTSGPGATGARITGNLFDHIYKEGILFGAVSLNATGHNIFYDVGNHFSGSTGTPHTSIISIEDNNNISISDLFERPDSFSLIFPRINLNNTLSIATTNGSQLSLGALNVLSGNSMILLANTGDAAGNAVSIFSADTSQLKTLQFNYSAKVGSAYRTGTIVIAERFSSNSVPVFTDDWVQNDSLVGPAKLFLTVTQDNSNIQIKYNTVELGTAGTISYSVNYLT
jgi:hypothetical protein